MNARENALSDVLAERARQDKKWGEQNHSDEWWLAILSEEVGETSQAILHDKFGGTARGTTRKELVQVCAVALRWIECIDRRALHDENRAGEGSAMGVHRSEPEAPPMAPSPAPSRADGLREKVVGILKTELYEQIETRIAWGDYADRILSLLSPRGDGWEKGLRPEVIAFAHAMEAQLRANDHKPGWKSDNPWALLKRLREETAELSKEIGHSARSPLDILREAADVANFAMMIADVCGSLSRQAAKEIPLSHSVAWDAEARLKAVERAEAAEADVAKWKEASTINNLHRVDAMQREEAALKELARLKSQNAELAKGTEALIGELEKARTTNQEKLK